MLDLLQRTSVFESSLDEEDSHYFLSQIQQNNWFSYSSKSLPIEEVTAAIESYVLLHASVALPNNVVTKLWTPKPLGIFRYVMDSFGDWHEISEFKPFDGYLVQGAYWSNGFYYIVSYKDFLLESNLFVDIQTREQYNYL